MASGTANRVAVLAPAPLLTITVERRGERADIHLHAGGQGFWIARLLAELDVDVVLCASFGGETGDVARLLVEREGVVVRSVAAGCNPAYIHDRRSGSRSLVVETSAASLSRHEIDELYGLMLVEGLEADLCVLGGPSGDQTLEPEVYRRLARDLRRNGKLVVADLSGATLREAVAGGVWAIKISHEELVRDAIATSDSPDDLIRAMLALQQAGAANVVVSRAEQPALALLGDELFAVEAPRVDPLDEHGAGDAMTAGIAAGLARGADILEAVRLGAAAGDLNVARHGLGTGRREEIERLAGHVRLERLELPAGVEELEPVHTTPDGLAARARPR